MDVTDDRPVLLACSPVAQLPEASGDDHILKLENAREVYEFQDQLGRGSFGKVYKAIFKPTGETIAVKVRAH